MLFINKLGKKNSLFFMTTLIYIGHILFYQLLITCELDDKTLHFNFMMNFPGQSW